MAEGKKDEPGLEGRVSKEIEECKVWIGNLDKNLTEFQLLQIVKKYGGIKNFNFMFHMNGPLKGEPRGYCFVEYETKQNALKAIEKLNGKQVLSKKIVVDFARKQSLPDEFGINARNETRNDEQADTKFSRQKKIEAIEEKLLLMEKGIETEVKSSLGKCRTEKQFANRRANPYSHHRKKPTRR